MKRNSKNKNSASAGSQVGWSPSLNPPTKTFRSTSEHFGKKLCMVYVSGAHDDTHSEVITAAQLMTYPSPQSDHFVCVMSTPEISSPSVFPVFYMLLVTIVTMPRA